MGNEVALMPQSFGAKLEMATTLVKSGLLPQGLNTPEKVCVALQWGHELGLSPMVAVNNVAVINGKPTLSADIMAAVVKRSPEYGGIKWTELSEQKAECVIIRILPNGEKESITSSFTIQDAMKAGLATRDVWRKYPKRMLKHRCLSYGLKDMFPDLLAGLYTPEEMESASAGQQEQPTVEETEEYENVINVTPTVTEPSYQSTNNSSSPTEAYLNLEQMLTEHGNDLKFKNLQKGHKHPYDVAKECLDNPASTDDDYVAMYSRCVSFLDKKGIKVA